MAEFLSRIEAQLIEGSEYNGPYLSRIELILKDILAKAGKIGFRGPYESISELPDPGEEGYIYLVETSNPEDNYFDEYYYNATLEAYVSMGTSELELSNYFTKDEVTALLSGKANISDLETKADLVNGKVPDSQIPDSVHDVVECNSVSDLPEIGDVNKLYIVGKTTYKYKKSSTSTPFVNGQLTVDNTGGEETPVTLRLTFTEYSLPGVYQGMWYGVGCGSYSDLSEYPEPRDIPGSTGVDLVNAFQIIEQEHPVAGDTITINNYDDELSIIYHSSVDDVDYDISSCVRTIGYGEQQIPLTLDHEQYLIANTEQTFIFTNAAAGSLTIDLIIDNSGYEVVGADYSAAIAAKQNTVLSHPITINHVQYTTVEDALNALSNMSGAEFVQTLPQASSETMDKLYVVMTNNADPALYITQVSNNVYSWFKLSGSDVEAVTSVDVQADYDAIFGDDIPSNPNLVNLSTPVINTSDVTIVDP